MVSNIINPNDAHVGERDKPELHYIGDIPKHPEVVDCCRAAALRTGWKIIFMPDHPKHPPNRLSIWTYQSFGSQRPFWEAFEQIMRSNYGDNEYAWPQGPALNDGPPPPRSTTRYYHS